MSRRLTALCSLLIAILPAGPSAGAQSPTIEQFLAPASPLEVRSARRADRIAWVAYERGMRNVYTAAAPLYHPVRLTSFLKDDGTDLTNLSLSDDGSVIVFVRGSAPNRNGWVANPSHDPAGAERAIWAVRSTGGPAWRLAGGAAPALSPDGRYVVFVRDSQIYRARVAAPVPATPLDKIDRGDSAFIREWGAQTSPRWSPDGSKIAFVSTRPNHSFIGVYDMRTRAVEFLAPSVDFDGSPVWSPDSRQVAFTRRPGTPFGQQAQAGGGGIGMPPGPASAATTPGPQGSGRGGGRGDTTPAGRGQLQVPGLYRATFTGGYTLSVMIADVATGKARELWHNAPNERVFTAINNMQWAGNNLVFPLQPMGDEWERYYSLATSNVMPAPVLLTTTNGLIEDATSAIISADGNTLYYCTNAGDIERRHIWAVPTAGGSPRQVSLGDGIETFPAPLASGKDLAVLYADARRPQSLGIVPVSGGTAKVIYPTMAKDFPFDREVVPQIVTFRSPDTLEIHSQLFLPKDLTPGQRRPAIIFVHGGPQRQMLPGYHYMQFYHWAYAVNQWLASQGYVVLSVNYRSGIGYGRAFRNAANTNARGNSEYQDVLAAAKYLQGRADVDPKRVGIWGLSYGGLLTSQALARNSDIFVAGADLAGVHLYGSQLDTTALSYTSSAISQIAKWKSPVFLVHGDDDRNVDFSQTIGLVDLLRAHNVYYELTVIPDDVHESLIHSRWVDVFGRMGDFLKRFVWNAGDTRPTAADMAKPGG